MNVNELLKKKLKKIPSVYKFDRKTGRYYVPNQSMLQFPAGYSLADAKVWLVEAKKLVSTKDMDVELTKMSSDGTAVINGSDTGIFCTGIATGKLPPPPKPHVIPIPFDYVVPAFVVINQEMQIIHLTDSEVKTKYATPVTQ